jgi:hypothetical protein
MPTPETLTSYWRKLMDSWREAAKDRMIPEYSEHEERHQNHRYYR